ncbi:beta-ketoacyl-ACP synthase II [Methylomonas sp. MED-D]|uniref:3-oxoacyl-[acyl-carrier-protein] synthase 2 n=1 Tax=Methylomonas koyamae TaxID=702114 RepID=A0A177NPY7_9GAMM|nr:MULTISPECIES: beta-ketoacyl-ACP synthase II [Methylomonas]NJA05421.1 beta-ketoacyl-ACP synthase II [Methylococcaceae bacterium WWC4]MDT4331381.1 beta-ketoacyl-ACP synthase II [Methylomonas sp. MV1]OAI20137.1 beta-ketoacyl-[acyl-carrier-protein] synthase II [Methylomonas koyamae]OHX36090.1 beta-ketoacyl-[acyl-carrier-protein] synthase II [Methylomonas sp. LWB]WGS84484.1 beta-ketoacyl-ACP synthase II [Methylomonas sp. UP202]
MSTRRVVITGLGAVTPLANNVADTWDGIVNGKSGISPIDSFDISPFATTFGGVIRNFNIGDYIAEKDAKRMDGFVHYGIAAGCQAFEDSGIVVTEQNAERIGVAIGAGIGGITGIEECYATYTAAGPRRISPFFVPGNIINMISGNLSIKYGLKGPNFAIVTACSTGTHNIGDAARLIKYGDADVMVAGGAERCTTSPTAMGGFAAAKALSRRNDDPQRASRPWDRDRDGFVLSDGAGVIVLEELEHAKARGAKIYAELVGYGMSGDAYHITSPSEGGEGAARCMRNAMRDAKLNPEDIDYINAHGTSTPAGDIGETHAMKAALGEYAYKVAVSSTKSMIGHLLGAAGGIEAVLTSLAICNQIAPPTINLENPDPECDLDYVPNIARNMKIDVAISNSFGFGGTNGSLVFKRYA